MQKSSSQSVLGDDEDGDDDGTYDCLDLNPLKSEEVCSAVLCNIISSGDACVKSTLLYSINRRNRNGALISVTVLIGL